jgi:ABC-type nitrate/sulfonate/bicarbonate transport system ATPase subunit
MRGGGKQDAMEIHEGNQRGDRLLVRVETKSYADPSGHRREVLRNVSFSGGAGEIIALLAPSGAGKTTMLRIVLGLDRDFVGEVRCPEGRIGVMFQEPRLLPWLTVEANLRLIARGNITGTDTDEIASLLAAVGLAGTESLHPKALSLGMARRVALVRALLGHPLLLVLDEPFASLDRKSAADLMALITRTARRDGALVLLTTHDLDQALGLADRLLLLAGQPARLAADCPTRGEPQSRDATLHAGLKESLLTRFPFLRAAPIAEEAP